MSILTKQAGKFTEAEIDDEIVVMHLGTGEFFALTGPAAATWRLIDGTRDRNALIGALLEEFEGNEREIVADVDDFLMQLKAIGLVGDA
jgi:hypothetical protein